MEKYKNLKKGTKVGLVISFLFELFGIGFVIYNIFNMFADEHFVLAPIVRDFVYLLIFVALLFYALIGYKKPHGNLLKTLFVAFGVSVVVIIGMAKSFPDTNEIAFIVSNICADLGALVIIFVAGRLHKIEKNKILLVIAGLLMLVRVIISIFCNRMPIGPIMNDSIPLLMLFALCFAYTARYEEHKAAGLEEK